MTDDFEVLAELGGAAAIEMVASALVDHGANATRCPNCGAPMIGPYCAACGQERNIHRRSVRELGKEFLGELASFDSRILRTAFALVAKPGELSLAFREGRPRRYVPALRLYLFVSLIFFLSLSAAGIALLQLEPVSSQSRIVADSHHNVFAITNGQRSPMEGFTADNKGNVYFSPLGVRPRLTNLKADGSVHQNIATQPHFFARLGTIKGGNPAQSKVLAQLEKDSKSGDAKKTKFGQWVMHHVVNMMRALETDPAAVNGPLTEWIPRILFILLPLFALVLAAFYWRQRKQFYFVDHLVFSLNYHSFGFVLLLFAAALAQIVSNDTVATLVVIGAAVYLLLAMKRFYGQSWFWTGAKFACVGFLYLCFLFPTLLAVLLISLWRI
jgi:hypothetical protein